MGKRALYEQIEMELADSCAYAGAVMARNMTEPEATEGTDAFPAKHKAAWATGS